MVKAASPGPARSKRKAISTLFPYIFRLGRSGGQGMAGTLLRTIMALDSEGFIWDRAEPFLMRPSNTQTPPSLDWVITLLSPHAPWNTEQYDGNMVTRWAKAASAVSYTEEVGQNVVDVLLQIASVDSLRPHIPAEIWVWLKKQPSLPPQCPGRSRGSSGDVVYRVRSLGDIEILKSYLVLVWSEWDCIDDQDSGGLAEMQVSIREDFGGVEMWHHRQDLIKRLDYVLEQLDGGLDGLKQHKPSLETDHISRAVAQYSELKRVMVEIDAEAMNSLARMPLQVDIFRSTDTQGYTQNTTRLLYARCPSHARDLRTLVIVFANYPVHTPPHILPLRSPALLLSARTSQICLDVRYPALLGEPVRELVPTLYPPIGSGRTTDSRTIFFGVSVS